MLLLWWLRSLSLPWRTPGAAATEADAAATTSEVQLKLLPLLLLSLLALFLLLRPVVMISQPRR